MNKNETASNDLLGSFATVGTEKIEEAQNDTAVAVALVFKTYPNKYFTQKELVKGLNKSNPFINKILHRLIEAKIIVRTKGPGKFFYKAAQ